MEKHEKILEEQQAPLKNTDHAFVKVGKDGQPVVPETTERKEGLPDKPERDTRPDKQ